ncbi:MAG: hypothetical protein JXR51_07405 [Bacteroidales bacterium]|nr:hypothetical protein [Bacteroidales bacterium]MBN2756989.1 hypothetical protein [Bacteroidales bacterium]
MLIKLNLENISHCRENINVRYNGWPNDKHRANTEALETITPFLNSIDITYNDKVLFMSDGSFNISLYLMNRKGYTATNNSSEKRIMKQLNLVDYLIVNDTSYVSIPYLKARIDKPIGTYKNISIYSLKSN